MSGASDNQTASLKKDPAWKYCHQDDPKNKDAVTSRASGVLEKRYPSRLSLGPTSRGRSRERAIDIEEEEANSEETEEADVEGYKSNDEDCDEDLLGARLAPRFLKRQGATFAPFTTLSYCDSVLHNSGLTVFLHFPFQIRQYKRLEDGSLNVVTRGQQRFHLKRWWVDVEGSPCAEVQIIQEDLALRTPRDVVGRLTPLKNLRAPPLDTSRAKRGSVDDDDSDAISDESFENELSLAERRLHQSAVASSYGYDKIDTPTSSDDEKFGVDSELQFYKSPENVSVSEKDDLRIGKKEVPCKATS
ncbi:ATP-dependent protease La (LON) domain protein [Actinidia rufa]|uniref:ATP-dependent protease La (LON) domain protein n=1 Tax=Actinidia rufa TaxID=165716 RepID=A0A7J0FFH5_9ERIC|nr:ATP-dependent protease La (LON) domain protein [Actinidia rufa]